MLREFCADLPVSAIAVSAIAVLLSPAVLIGLSCLTQRVYGAATAPAIVGWCC